jgi:hypothetical protein
MNQEDNTEIQDLESNIEHWMLSNPHDFESTFGEDLVSAVSEVIGDE